LSVSSKLGEVKNWKSKTMPGGGTQFVPWNLKPGTEIGVGSVLHPNAEGGALDFKEVALDGFVLSVWVMKLEAE
jgi:hypothetical protein